MALLIYRAILSVALGACLASFVWGMRNVFVLPSRPTSGMKLTALSGAVVGLLNFGVILASATLLTSLVFAALALYLLALGLFWWTALISGGRRLPACFTKIEPSGLVTNGPYRFVRHPFYVSYMTAWAAGAVATLSPWLISTFLLMSLLYLSAALTEEKALLNGIHSSEYLHYRNRTGMFIPRPEWMKAKNLQARNADLASLNLPR
jgi:protein-S-isoprenylcysteine O-methyltransferase Ste14